MKSTHRACTSLVKLTCPRWCNIHSFKNFKTIFYMQGLLGLKTILRSVMQSHIMSCLYEPHFYSELYLISGVRSLVSCPLEKWSQRWRKNSWSYKTSILINPQHGPKGPVIIYTLGWGWREIILSSKNLIIQT